MPGIFQSLDIARRAIWASRLGMDVTSHNIANVNTPGYSRQRVENRAAYPLQLPQGQLGLGVSAEMIVRVRNGMLDAQYRQTAFTLGNASVKEKLYSEIESIISEPDENSVGNLMTEFFSEFSNLAADPESTSIRNLVRQKAQTLVQTFHHKNDQLNLMKQSIQKEVGSAVSQINEISRQIAKLNQQISSGEAGGGSANDLRDRRDMLIDRLSEYVKVTYSEDQLGRVTVNGEGFNLVSGTKANELSVESVGEKGTPSLKLVSESGKTQIIRYGKLGGLIEMYNQTIPDLLNKLDTLASNLAEEVNRFHRAGQGLPKGDPPTPSTGINFFTGNSAATLNISVEVMEDVANIAASNDGSPGNGDVAMAIANVRNQKIFNGRTQTLDDYYTGMISSLGEEIQKVQNTVQSQEMLKDQIENQREAVSGVSLDEEMTNLIKYQRSFEAAAKVVRVVDEIMQTVIDMI